MAQTWEIQFKCKEEKKTAFVQTVEQVSQRNAEVSVFGNTQNPTGQSLEQPAVDDPALSRKVGLNGLQRCLPTSVIL